VKKFSKKGQKAKKKSGILAMHDTFSLFIGERYNFIRNYKYVHKACINGL
jgi:hypothetical protein